MRITLYGMNMDLPSDWLDVTHDLPDETPPTLTRADGDGVLQFTIARYASGEHPRASEGDLRDMLTRFCSRLPNRFDAPTVRGGRIMSAGRISRDKGETIAVWYLSNGQDFVLATYYAQSDSGAVESELRDVRQSMESMDF